jgi:hypothetical protein
MTIASYNDLVTAVQNWLYGRTDLQARVPEFISLCEAKLNRQLKCRQMIVRETAMTDPNATEPEFITLPANFHSLARPPRIKAGAATGRPRLKYASALQIDEIRFEFESNGASPGEPQYYTVLGSELELVPTPDKAYTIEIATRQYIPGLANSNQTNWLITLAPDAYLYGVLMEAAPYMHEDERIATWANGLTGAINGLNALSDEATYNAGPLTMRRRGHY